MIKVKKIAYSFSSQKSHPVFSDFFSNLKDPRRTQGGHHLYPLNEILFVCISSVISGVNDWTTISLFGRTKIAWLHQYFPYKNRIPFHDVLGKVFAALDLVQFNQCFTNWVNSISVLTGGEVIAIDGKTICGSDDKHAGKSAIHVVSAYAAGNRLCLDKKLWMKKVTK